MNHQYWEDQLILFYDSELSKSDRNRVHVHILSCQNCQANLEKLKLTSTTLKQLKTPSVNTGAFVTRILAQLGPVPQKISWFEKIFSWKLTAAVLGIGTILLILTMPKDDSFNFFSGEQGFQAEEIIGLG